MIHPMAIDVTLDCGCRVQFLDTAPPGTEFVHQKPQVLVDSYNDFFGKKYPEFAPKKLLEIGVFKGGSLTLWRHVFGCPVIGLDITLPESELAAFRAHQGHDLDVFAWKRDQSTLRADTLPFNFDLVVDDGSHEYLPTSKAFDLLWPHVNPGGFYIIEDWRVPQMDYPTLMRNILEKVVGYWPQHELPVGAPREITIYRDFMAMKK